MIKGDRRGLEGAKQPIWLEEMENDLEEAEQPIHLEEIEGSLEVME